MLGCVGYAVAAACSRRVKAGVIFAFACLAFVLALAVQPPRQGLLPNRRCDATAWRSRVRGCASVLFKAYWGFQFVGVS